MGPGCGWCCCVVSVVGLDVDVDVDVARFGVRSRGSKVGGGCGKEKDRLDPRIPDTDLRTRTHAKDRL
jgi:hypothetical protein